MRHIIPFKSIEIKYARVNLLNGDLQIFIYAMQRMFYQTPIIGAKNQFLKYDVRPQNHLIKSILLGFYVVAIRSRELRLWRKREREKQIMSHKWEKCKQKQCIAYQLKALIDSVHFLINKNTDSYFFKHPPLVGWVLWRIYFSCFRMMEFSMIAFVSVYHCKLCHFICCFYWFICFYCVTFDIQNYTVNDKNRAMLRFLRNKNNLTFFSSQIFVSLVWFLWRILCLPQSHSLSNYI